MKNAALASIAVGLFCSLTVASCTATPRDFDLEEALHRFDLARQRSAEEAEIRAQRDFEALQLPVSDLSGAVQYCAFMVRSAVAEDHSMPDAARSRAAWINAKDSPFDGASDPIGFGDLFPTIRSTPYFSKQTSDGSVMPVYLATDTGSCSFVTQRPGADALVERWLESPKSDWVEIRLAGIPHWRVYRIRTPDSFTSNVRIFRSTLPDRARVQGVTGAYVVAIVGLP